MRPMISPKEAQARLQEIFPHQAFGTNMSSEMASWVLVGMLYMDAVAPADADPPTWARPTSPLWQQQNVLLEKTEESERLAWAEAAARSRKRVEKLVEGWGLTVEPRYAENSRETVRRKVLVPWFNHSAIRTRPGVATNYGGPRWALEWHFANLFDPELEGNELTKVIEEWTEQYLDVGARLRAHRAREAEAGEFAVTVTLPGGKQRALEHGGSSRLLKGVIEEWAPKRLVDPVVLTISEPGDKVFIDDQKVLDNLGVKIDAGNLLPDALIVDIGTTPAAFWIIEAVHTDGPIHEHRKGELLEWAEQQRIKRDSCRFLTAFDSRNAAPARRLLKDLATGTFAWYLDEPDKELSWDALEDGSENVTQFPKA